MLMTKQGQIIFHSQQQERPLVSHTHQEPGYWEQKPLFMSDLRVVSSSAQVLPPPADLSCTGGAQRPEQR